MSQATGQNFSARVAYDGTNYAGFQLQTNAGTIQGELERSLAELAGEEIRVHGASRTDAGVHAIGQVISFKGVKLPAADEIESALSTMLPPDIRVSSVHERADDFNARYSTAGKIYAYRIFRSEIQSPFLSRYSHWIRRDLSLELMAESASLFEGEFDFSSFSSRLNEGENPVKRIDRVEIRERGEILSIECDGTGFLYQMVRRITGAVIDVGLDKVSIDEVARWIREPEIGLSKTVAPAKGLFLMEIRY